MKKWLFLQWLIFSFAFPWMAWLGHTSSNIIYTMSGLIIGVALVHIILLILEIKNQKKQHNEIQELIERSKRECEEKIKELEEARAKLNVTNP